MPEERKTIEARVSASPEVYHMARFEKAFPWLLAGGAALVLLETYRKNANDRAKANADFKAALKNQEHQAEVLKEQIRQFDENAFQERKAERRERYTTAVEQLGNASAPVRMGGVYTLIGLVDEWLEEENLSEPERVREGQIIVNNLCAYIRSPFILASYYDELSEDKPSSEGIYKDNQQKFYTDKAEFKSEADIRLSIIKEIHDRLQGPDINTPGAWSDFEYDFSGSTFFYPVDLTNSYYTKPVNFSGSTYQDEVRFDGSVYKDEADFGSSIYKSWATFDGSTYTGWVGFNCSTYQSWADFSGSTYEDKANFSGSIFCGDVYYGKDRYNSNFSRFTECTPQFYNENSHQNTLFGSPDNDFSVENGRGYPVYRNLDGLPLGCDFLTTEQKEYLEDKFQEIDETKNKFLEVKDPKEKAELSKNLQALTEELYEWREEATTVKMESTAPGEEDN